MHFGDPHTSPGDVPRSALSAQSHQLAAMRVGAVRTVRVVDADSAACLIFSHGSLVPLGDIMQAKPPRWRGVPSSLF